jgi:hypothetical protein
VFCLYPLAAATGGAASTPSAAAAATSSTTTTPTGATSAGSSLPVPRRSPSRRRLKRGCRRAPPRVSCAAFPEGVNQRNTVDYELVRSYFHSRDLRRLRCDAWPPGHRRPGSPTNPSARSCPRSRLPGFDGIHLDRLGYADHGAKAVRQVDEFLKSGRLCAQTQGSSSLTYGGRLRENLSAATRSSSSCDPRLIAASQVTRQDRPPTPTHR